MRYSNNRKNLLDNDKLSHFFIYVVMFSFLGANVKIKQKLKIILFLFG